MVSGFVERVTEGSGSPIGPGVLVAVVGASGVGKDTLLAMARPAFGKAEDVLFVRRTITRPPDPDGENHEAVSSTAFETRRVAGEFALAWQAHGLSYGLPVALDRHVARGNVAVANGSRAALPLMVARYRNLMVVHVTARPEILAGRLAARGRESEAAILARLGRADAASFEAVGEAFVIDNSGDPHDAAEALVGVIRKAIARSTVSNVV
ncbi:phosphonate metabolism protein/1,5-bisphosphokinase (PRPP-forming) PhnN [Pararhizobium mangrovi]|uniref:Ribose 1,5-bisphosphate phosphokinase PhnN n=1 Tax=Pararhizobium mangrovi TaxID=2590452 RepID=A0A506U221_9HYPH|nr:phosphonate metabolism protein/1,5-bisphosphokinase (PRPP-forming) PhnN [Pararhizobium mangrovi]TPW26619.1 phosphonate metabolism protein/1,5-bisphosphokinase (PRPP-forming) PhnN [Pararhizobium mangrovi]